MYVGCDLSMMQARQDVLLGLNPSSSSHTGCKEQILKELNQIPCEKLPTDFDRLRNEQQFSYGKDVVQSNSFISAQLPSFGTSTIYEDSLLITLLGILVKR